MGTWKSPHTGQEYRDIIPQELSLGCSWERDRFGETILPLCYEAAGSHMTVGQARALRDHLSKMLEKLEQSDE